MEMQYVDLYRSGVMTSGANTDPAPVAWVLGDLPAQISYILRAEWSCASPSSGDADSVWHLDIRKDLSTGDFGYAGTNAQIAMFIPDGAFHSEQNFNTVISSLPNYAAGYRPAITAQPTNIGASHNNGTGPTDLKCRLYYV